MPSNASDRLSQRGISGALALLVQVAAVFLFVVSRPSIAPTHTQRETIFLLPRIPEAAPPAPPIIGAPAAPVRKPVVPAPAPAAPSVAAPPSGLAGFGQSLFGCAPENYANLTPDARAHCTRPGEGLAYNRAPDLMGPDSHVKDNARWANAMAHRQTVRMLPGGMLFPLVALIATLDGSITEPHSAFRDPEQWPNETDPSRFMPRSLNEQERVYDAWRKDHPVK